MNEAFLENLHANPWTHTLLDLPELNQEASGLIEERVRHLRSAAQGEPDQLRSESLVILGPPGTGKTHLFARVRKRLGPRAVFVHLRPLLHSGLTASYALSEAISQLAQPSFGRDEWQVEALVGSLIGHLEGPGGDFPIAHLSTFRDLSVGERTEKLEEVTEKLLERFSDLDDVFVERLLRLPFVPPRQRRALLAWLTGRDCDQSQLSRIGAAASMPKENTIRALRTLTSTAALGSPLVLVFDQLENLIQNDKTEERVTQYGNLIAELVDSTRGLLVVQMALDSEWEQGIGPRLNLSQKSRVTMKKVSASLPTPPQSKELLRLWHSALEQPEEPFPWPLTSSQAEALSELPGVTPRMLLAAFKECLDGQEPSILETPIQSGETASSDPAEQTAGLPEEWHARLVAAHEHLDQADAQRAGADADRLCDGLLLASRFAEGAELSATSDEYIQLEPKAGGRWISLLHQGHYKSVGAALDRVLKRTDTRPGLLLREQWRPMLPTWKATNQLLTEALARPHLDFHELTREEAASLLALEEILQAARSQDLCDARGRPLTEQQVMSYLRDEVEPGNWAVVQRLTALSEAVPSGEAAPQPPAEDKHKDNQNAGPENSGPIGGALEPELESVLRRLRVVSVDRMIREVQQSRPHVGRLAIVASLKKMADRVDWFGRNLIAWGGKS